MTIIKDTLLIFIFTIKLLFLSLLGVLIFLIPLFVYISNLPKEFNPYYFLNILPMLLYYSFVLAILKHFFGTRFKEIFLDNSES